MVLQRTGDTGLQLKVPSQPASMVYDPVFISYAVQRGRNRRKVQYALIGGPIATTPGRGFMQPAHASVEKLAIRTKAAKVLRNEAREARKGHMNNPFSGGRDRLSAI